MQTLPLSSQPADVVVFRHGAQVTRLAELVASSSGWPSMVDVRDLPLALVEGTVQVATRSEGSASAPIATSVRVELSSNPKAFVPDTIHDAVRLARRTAELANAVVEELEHAREQLERLNPISRPEPKPGQPPLASPLTGRLALSTFRETRTTDLLDRLREAKDTQRIAHEKLHSAEEAQRRVSTAEKQRATELRYVATIDLAPGAEPPEPGQSVTLEIRYQVTGVRWAPTYTLRLNADYTQGFLELRALLAQWTGEDWSNVNMVVSTAVPQQWTELPQLQALRIGRRQTQPTIGWRPAPTETDGLFLDFDQAFPNARRALAKAKPAKRPPMPPPASAPEPLSSEMLSRDVSAHQSAPLAESYAEDRAAPELPLPTASLARSSARGVGSLLASAFGSRFDDGGPLSSPLAAQGPATQPPVAPSPLADQPQLDYANLVMSGPGSLQRGRLFQREATAAPSEPIHAFKLRTKALDRRAPPSGCQVPATEAGFDFAYAAQGPASLRSDGVFHNIAIQSLPLAGEARFVAVPRATRDVFRTLHLRNPLPGPVLPGPVDVYIDGRFRLTSHLDRTPIDGRIELGLGIEPAIKVARNVAYDETSAGMLKRSHSFRHEVTIDIANQRSTPTHLEVRERLPTAPEHDETVVVDIENVSPPWYAYDQDGTLKSGHAWRLTIPAHTNQQLRVVYSIRVPHGFGLIGGNRRESL